MERDMELVRAILLRVESAEEIIRPPIEIDGYEQKIVDYHVVLLHEAELIIGGWTKATNGVLTNAIIHRLTWKGHEFLNAAKNEGVWAQAKDAFQEKSFGMTYEVMKTLLQSYTEKKLGLKE